MAKPKKRSKGLIPKRIAGVKVPKAVRKGRFGELLASRTGQAVIAQAILGAGAVAAGMKAADNPEVRARARAAKTTAANEAHDAADAAASAGSALAYALGEAAHAFAEALKRGGPKAAASGPPDADAPASPSLARQ
ncbi:MAG: hypothetical protein JNK30_18670 [Phenylobacterium sp.]|uniref:hypothetical protein n=1 Tax=Phenylobacterium sp. TaxID=1871053 RepID=UPI001A476968|nr:hypothetical protein [Phenylobacterium sp.]MBL8773415.1 hypothetical protein [Phenylobacterium sp.]